MSASPYSLLSANLVAYPLGNFLATALAREIPLQLMPLLLRNKILSPAFNFLSVISLFLSPTTPIADPPRSIVSFSITPFNVGVSPPPHVAIEILQASRQPPMKSFILRSSSNQLLSSIAQ